MKHVVITSVLIALAAPAFAQSGFQSTTTKSASDNQSMTKGTSSTESVSTQDFVKKAAQGDMFEIQSSQLAELRTKGKMKDFAQKMADDHQKTTSELKSALNSDDKQVKIPASMSEKQKEMLQKLQSLKGDAFKKQYKSDQVSAHQMAVDLFRQYGNSGDNSDLKQWASKTLPTLQNHLDMARNLPD